MSQRYQVMLVPEEGGDVREFSVARSFVVWAGAGVLFCLLSLVCSVWLFTHHRGVLADAASIEAENTSLHQHLSRMETRLDSLGTSVAAAEELDREARLLAGLDPVDPETRRLGVGGPRSAYAEAPAVRPQVAFRLETQAEILDELERRVAFQERSYNETIAILETQKDRIDRTPTISPLRHNHAVSSGFGYRDDPFTGERAFHYGMDLNAPEGTPVYATAGGKITTVETKRDYGLTVVIDHGDGVETRYAHLAGSDRKKGDTVVRGDVIGELGNTGRSTGPHVHYEVRIDGVAQDPRDYVLLHRTPENHQH